MKHILPLALLFAATPVHGQTAAEIREAGIALADALDKAEVRRNKGWDKWPNNPIGIASAEMMARAIMVGDPDMLAMLDRLRPKAGGQVCPSPSAQDVADLKLGRDVRALVKP